MKSGVLYIASESEYLVEAVQSMESLRKVMPNTPIALIADVEEKPPYVDHLLDLNSIPSEYSDKVFNIQRTPFEKTIYLDTDTTVNNDISEIFDLLDNYEIAVAHNDNRTFMPGREYPVTNIPDCFPEYNTGVIGFNQRSTDELFNRWREIYSNYTDEDYYLDQPAFRKALFETDIYTATLPTEFNCRFHYGGYVAEEIRVFHGRHPAQSQIFDQLNSTDSPRAFVKQGTDVSILDFREPHLIERLVAYVRYRQYENDFDLLSNTIKEDGIPTTIYKMYRNMCHRLK